MFRSKNWDHLKSLNVKSKVLYTHADLDLTLTQQVVRDVPTTVVLIENDGCRYIGVAQCGPRDEYSQKKGREIAAGRALKALAQHAENPNLNPSDVWESNSDEQAHIFGNIPLSLEDDHRLDDLVFSRSY